VNETFVPIFFNSLLTCIYLRFYRTHIVKSE